MPYQITTYILLSQDFDNEIYVEIKWHVIEIHKEKVNLPEHIKTKKFYYSIS